MLYVQLHGALAEVNQYSNRYIHDDQLAQVETPVVPVDEGTELI